MEYNFDNINFAPGSLGDLEFGQGETWPPVNISPGQPQVPLPAFTPAGQGGGAGNGPGFNPGGFNPGGFNPGDFDFSSLPQPGGPGMGGLNGDFAGFDGSQGSGFDGSYGGAYGFGGPSQGGGDYDAEGYNAGGFNAGGLTRDQQAGLDDFMAANPNGFNFGSSFGGVYGDGPLGGAFGGSFGGSPAGPASPEGLGGPSGSGSSGSSGGAPPPPVVAGKLVGDLDMAAPAHGPTGAATEYAWSPPVAPPASGDPFKRPDTEAGIASLARG